MCKNVKYILSDTYFCCNSIKNENNTLPIKIVTKKEEPLSLYPADLSKVKRLAFPASLCNFENQSLIIIQ